MITTLGQIRLDPATGGFVGSPVSLDAFFATDAEPTRLRWRTSARPTVAPLCSRLTSIQKPTISWSVEVTLILDEHALFEVVVTASTPAVLLVALVPG